MIKVIKNGTVITMDEKRNNKYEKLDIVITDNTITKVCENYDGPYDEIIDATNKIVLPGLINSHTHLGMSIFRATNDNLDLNTWLTKKIWPIEAKMDDKIMYDATLLSCIEMIKTGTTTANDMYFNYKAEGKAIEDAKIRCKFTSFVIDDLNEEGLRKIRDFEQLLIDFKDKELLTFSVGPHGLYTCSKDLMLKVKELADKYNIPVHIHFCENLDEIKTIEEKHGMSPANCLKEYGLLENKLILAHCTFVNESEQEILKSHDVSFVHNPVSNLNLGCGFANITEYKKNGINVCLGTDGQGSGNNMNLFYHMSFVDFIQKGLYKDPTIASSYETLKMATINGAKALGMDNIIGSIEEGKKADIVILDMNNIEVYPTIDIITQVVHNVESNNVDTTIINGEVLMKNHELTLPINEQELMNRLNLEIKEIM